MTDRSETIAIRLRIAEDHLEKAKRLLAGGRHSLVGTFAESAGREAYLAAYHAALAYIVVQTGKRPKTHRGARTEFARVAREDARLNPAYARFLGFAYDLKEVADYDEVRSVTLDAAERALKEAAQMVDGIAAVLAL